MACQQEVINLSITKDLICKSVKSFAHSKRYTKIMIKASILNILYQRLILNESDLKTRKYKDIPFMVFKGKTPKDPMLRQYLSWVKGIMEAIDKNYLKEIFLYMKDPTNEEIVESYRFRLKYNLDDNGENRRTSTQAKEATLALMQVICDLGKCNKLVEKTIVQLELTYYETTPETYEPPGFEQSEGKYCLSISNCNNHLATLNTGFHKLACYGGGLNLERPFTPVAISEVINEEEMRIHEAYCASTVQNISSDQMLVDESETQENPVIPKTSIANVPQEEYQNISNITISDHFETNISITSGRSALVMMTDDCQIDCVCELAVTSDAVKGLIISCISCKKLYHAPCHGYLTKDAVSLSSFTCINCDTNDKVLIQFNKKERPLVAKVRLVLYFMDRIGKLPVDIMQLMHEGDRATVYDKLESFSIITKEKKYLKKNEHSLKQVLPKFFQMDNSQLLQ